MPSEHVEITLSEADPYWSGALFMAVLAYPDPIEQSQRAQFHQSLIRWTLDQRMEIDPEWTQGLQLIRPGYFSGSDKLHKKNIAEGNKRLQRRSLVANSVVIPHLRAFDTGRTQKVDGFTPTFENMITRATAELGLASGSVATVAARDWRPLKPVAHAMCALMVWTSILWTQWGRNKDAKRQLAFLMLPEFVEEVVEISEHFRQQVVTIKDFEIREEQTIRLTTKWI